MDERRAINTCSRRSEHTLGASKQQTRRRDEDPHARTYVSSTREPDNGSAQSERLHVFVAKAEQIQNRVQARLVEAISRLFSHRSFGVERDTEAGAREHVEI